MTTDIYANKIRFYTIDMIAKLGFGHLGGALSIADILAVLYGEVMNIDPQNPNWDQRDYFVLSKGHGGPALYTTLAIKGYFPIETLYTLNEPPTIIPSHPDKRLTPGVDATTGSLGQGISQAVGIALGARLKGSTQRTYTIVGDGELQEGQCWEAIQHAAHEKLSNLVMFVDFNQLQLDGQIIDICNPFNLVDKLAAFGWNALSIDGHNFDEIRQALKKADECTSQPTAIIANTIKGKGVSQFEDGLCPHHLKLDDTFRSFLNEAIQKFAKLIK